MWLLLCACSVSASEAIAGEGGLLIQNARVALPIPGRPVSVAYMDIVNSRGDAIVLQGFTAEKVRKLELHQMLHEEGVMKMRPVNRYTLGAGRTLKLEPGGYHLMLFGVDQNIQAGDTAAMQLQLADGSKIDFLARIYDRRSE